jgi:hypothetical protein
MSEGENFLARWSARKLANRTEPAQPDTPAQQPPRDPTETLDNAAIAETQHAPGTAEKQATDPAPLPALDSIGADSSVAAFLRPDVPPELTRAALRRAWTSDPAIKNFVGLVENGWDFNDPSAMPGFGAISPAEVARLAGQVVAALPQGERDERAKDAPAPEKKSAAASAGAVPQSVDVTSDTAEEPGSTTHDAAQQSKTADTS